MYVVDVRGRARTRSASSGEGDAPTDAPKAPVGAVFPEAPLHRLRQPYLPVGGEFLPSNNFK